MIGKNYPVLPTLNIFQVKMTQNFCYRHQKHCFLGTKWPSSCNHSIVQLMAAANNQCKLFDIMATDQGRDETASD